MTIADFNCEAGVMQRITPALLERAGAGFPAAYLEADAMAKTALALKEANNACFCSLPFCHTLEAEATGGEIRLDDVETGPAFGAPIYRKLEQLADLPELDLTSGRIARTLEACSLLRQQNEHVLFSLTGPVTWLNILCGTGPIFKGLRKNPEELFGILDHLRAQLLRLAKAAVEAGADLIGYSDSIAGVNVMGPQNMVLLAERFAKPLLQDLLPILEGKAILLLCPKQAFALIGAELAQWRELPAGENVPYIQACLESGGRVFGQTCAKHYHVRVNGMVRELELKK